MVFSLIRASIAACLIIQPIFVFIRAIYPSLSESLISMFSLLVLVPILAHIFISIALNKVFYRKRVILIWILLYGVGLVGSFFSPFEFSLRSLFINSFSPFGIGLLLAAVCYPINTTANIKPRLSSIAEIALDYAVDFISKNYIYLLAYSVSSSIAYSFFSPVLKFYPGNSSLLSLYLLPFALYLKQFNRFRFIAILSILLTAKRGTIITSIVIILLFSVSRLNKIVRSSGVVPIPKPMNILYWFLSFVGLGFVFAWQRNFLVTILNRLNFSEILNTDSTAQYSNNVDLLTSGRTTEFTLFDNIPDISRLLGIGISWEQEICLPSCISVSSFHIGAINSFAFLGVIGVVLFLAIGGYMGAQLLRARPGFHGLIGAKCTLSLAIYLSLFSTYGLRWDVWHNIFLWGGLQAMLEFNGEARIVKAAQAL